MSEMIERLAKAIMKAAPERFRVDIDEAYPMAEAALECVRLRSSEAWAVHNNCQGVFTCGVAHSKEGAEARLNSGDYDGAGCTVVPVRVLVEPDDRRDIREWMERHYSSPPQLCGEPQTVLAHTASEGGEK